MTRPNDSSGGRTENDRDALIRHARDYAERGWRLLLFRRNGKNPGVGPDGEIITGWQTTPYRDADQIESAIRCCRQIPNIGLLTGRPSRVIAIDADDLETQQALLEEFPLLGRTRQHRSPGHGTCHFLLAIGEDVAVRSRSYKPDGKCIADLKADGGQIVVPPSIHPNGLKYEVVNDVAPVLVAEERLRDITRWLERRGQSGQARDIQRPPSTPFAMQGLPHDSPDETTVRSALAALPTEIFHDGDLWVQIGYAINSWDSGPRGLALWEEFSRRCPEFKEGEPARRWQKMQPNGAVTIGTLFHHAKLAGWRASARASGFASRSQGSTETEHSRGVGPVFESDSGAPNDASSDDRERPVPLAIARSIMTRRGYVFTEGDFHEFGGKVWEAVDPLQVDRETVRMVGGHARRALLGDVQHLVRVEAFDPDFFMCQADRLQMVALQNGVLDLRSMLLLPHRSEQRLRSLLPIAFDPGARCPRFEKALEEWLPNDPAARSLLVEFLGYLLVPDVSQHKALVLIGEGAGGKSTFLYVVEILVGTANTASVPIRSLRSDRTFPTAQLAGKLVNLAPEVEVSDGLDEAWLKSLIAGDPVDVERKHRDPQTMRPTARFIVQSNDAPKFADRSSGLWRRLMVVKFEGDFLDESKRDPALRAKLQAEASGILNLAIAGLHRLRERGRFETTDVMQRDLDAYRKECNPVAAWLDECVEPCCLPGEAPPRVEIAEAYRCYARWCSVSGHGALSRTKFTREVSRLGVKAVDYRSFGRKTRGFEGVSLLEG